MSIFDIIEVRRITFNSFELEFCAKNMRKRISFSLLLIMGAIIFSGCSFLSSSSQESSITESSSTVSSSIESSSSIISSESSAIESSSFQSSELISSSSSTTEKENLSLHIVSLNDVHGYIEQTSTSGIASEALLINNIRNAEPEDDVVLIANGDMFQGTFISNVTKGRAVIEAMNAMDFDCMGIGNHEFDWGIEYILDYFDGDESNGEANFPLINSNIYYKGTNDLLTVENGNVYESIVVEKEGIKVGIISYIGPLEGSILASRTADYTFDHDITESVSKLGTSLKANGADIIVVNIHDGNSAGIDYYDTNVELAELKYNNDYLVDAVINGHTHTNQYGTISRDNGVSMPVVQGAGYGVSFADIRLTFDYSTRNVISSGAKTIYTSTAYGNYDSTVNEIVLEQVANLEDPLLSTAGETVTSTYKMRTWAANVMLQATGADVAISNNGGLRTINLQKNSKVYESDMYELVPFDNEIIVCTISYQDLYDYLYAENTISNNYMALKSELSSSKATYKLAIIDYVYTGNYFDQSIVISELVTGLTYRELLIEDCKLHSVFSPYSDPTALISNKLS